MAMRAYQNVSAEEKAWAYHLSMDRAEADYWNGLELAEEKGRNNGIKQGELNRALSAARKMLTVHLGTHEQIAQGLGLSVQEVKELAEQDPSA